MPNPRVISGMITTPPPSPVRAPSRPARSEPAKRSDERTIYDIRNFPADMRSGGLPPKGRPRDSLFHEDHLLQGGPLAAHQPVEIRPVGKRRPVEGNIVFGPRLRHPFKENRHHTAQ